MKLTWQCPNCGNIRDHVEYENDQVTYGMPYRCFLKECEGNHTHWIPARTHPIWVWTKDGHK